MSIRRICKGDCEANFETGEPKFDICPYCKVKLPFAFYYLRDASKEYETYVLEEKKQIMGVMCIKRNSDEIYLSRIGILTGETNKGYGEQLFTFLLNNAVKLRKIKICCKVHKKKLDWFKQVGFEVIAKFSDPHWGDSYDMELNIIYAD